MEGGGDAIGVVSFVALVHLLTSGLSATPVQLRQRQPQVHSWVSPQSLWNSGPRSQSGQGVVPSKQGRDGFKMKPRREVRGSPVKSAANGGSFGCFRRRKFSREGSDRGFLDPRIQAKVRPAEERLKSCEENLERSLKKLEEVQGEVERARARLDRLIEEVASARLVEITPDL